MKELIDRTFLIPQEELKTKLSLPESGEIVNAELTPGGLQIIMIGEK